MEQSDCLTLGSKGADLSAKSMSWGDWSQSQSGCLGDNLSTGASPILIGFCVRQVYDTQSDETQGGILDFSCRSFRHCLNFYGLALPKTNPYRWGFLVSVPQIWGSCFICLETYDWYFVAKCTCHSLEHSTVILLVVVSNSWGFGRTYIKKSVDPMLGRFCMPRAPEPNRVRGPLLPPPPPSRYLSNFHFTSPSFSS